MLKPQVQQSNFVNTSLPLHKPFLHGTPNVSLTQLHSLPPICKLYQRIKAGMVANKPRKTEPIAAPKFIQVIAVVTVKQNVGGILTNIGATQILDDFTIILGKSLAIELISAQLDSTTGLEKEPIKGYASRKNLFDEYIKYEAKFKVPVDFGDIGAILVENGHHKEMFFKDISLHGLPNGPVNVTCGSWVHSRSDNPAKRVFFTKKSYLPSQTPSGLKKLREEELEILRGNGEGERKSYERIYDYDVYNDLGNPDSNIDLKRPVLGGTDKPYPKRCRTGRAPCDTDPLSEKRSSAFYVPRDEAFSEAKLVSFSAKTIYSVLPALLPSIESLLGTDKDFGFPHLMAVDSLFDDDEGSNLPLLKRNKVYWRTLLSIVVNGVKALNELTEDVLRFDMPPTMTKNKLFWTSDEEFARETLAGLNPYSIQLIKEWPLKSKLDPNTYGPAESAITSDIIEKEIKGFMTVEEAIKKKKLFILDYHDLLLPYVQKVREIEGTTLYGSRTILYLTPDGTLKPLAIELTRPPMDGKAQWKKVYTPSSGGTGYWLWRFAKTHVLAHDSGYHELVSHWLRTHCCTEPYIIATNRQLSAMHPVYRLLHPHFRYTMAINALARQALINGGGIIETSFSPAKYSMELCSAAYDQNWRFDLEALPADLINRGMAEEDPSAPNGLKLTIEDYPFANDGLVLCDSIKQWVSDYVNHYYPEPNLIQSDSELQAWWTEIRTVGHADKKDQPWWPELKTPKDLIQIITTMVWVTSGHHAAVNFGQYFYGGYFPNRPTIARTKMPDEDPSPEEEKAFLEKPEEGLLNCFPSVVQATKVMAILDVLSNHSPDEQYLGDNVEPSWVEDPVVKDAFERFKGRLKDLEETVDKRNGNKSLKNRNGAGIVPYELLKPFSEPGVTGEGVPYSISI